MIFGSGMSSGGSVVEAVRTAAAAALRAFGSETPKLAIVFASPSHADAAIPRIVQEVIGDIPVVGGTAGGSVIGSLGASELGVSVVLLGGKDVAIATRAAQLSAPELTHVVPAARELAGEADAAARRGFEHFVCLVFAPALQLDGEALVAAVRKGAGARAQLAGGLTGDDLTFDRMRVFVDGSLYDDRAVLVGLFTRKPIGIAARHGCRPVGPAHVVTRSEGDVLVELDHRPALEVWVDDARRAGGNVPEVLKDLRPYLANHYELGIAGAASKKSDREELVVRAPFELFEDGRVRVSGAIGEGLRVHVVHTSRQDCLRASTSAAADAATRIRGGIAGALVLSCSGRLAVLGDEFDQECARIQSRIGGPIGGACVYGEIAKSDRDVDAFFNTTVVVVAFPS